VQLPVEDRKGATAAWLGAALPRLAAASAPRRPAASLPCHPLGRWSCPCSGNTQLSLLSHKVHSTAAQLTAVGGSSRLCWLPLQSPDVRQQGVRVADGWDALQLLDVSSCSRARGIVQRAGLLLAPMGTWRRAWSPNSSCYLLRQDLVTKVQCTESRLSGALLQEYVQREAYLACVMARELQHLQVRVLVADVCLCLSVVCLSVVFA
jgi:hypothetical protein